MSNAQKIERLRTRATELHRSGALEDAERLYQSILALHRRDPEARHMLGVLRLQQGRAAEALALVEPLVAEVPCNAEIRTHLALIRHALGQHTEALADFGQALALKPANPMTLLYRGNTLLELGHSVSALADYDLLLRQAPQYDEAWFRRGSALWLLERFEEALASYDKALQFNPKHFAANFNRGTTLLKLDRHDDAFAAFEKTATLAPHHPLVLGGAASAVLGAGDLSRWAEYQARIVEAMRNRNAVVAPLILMPFCHDGALRRACSEAFVADRVPPSVALRDCGQSPPRDRIRIAYLSSDFHQHATAELIAGLIECHDRTRFEVTAVSFSRDDGSPMRVRLIQAFDHFVDVRNIPDTDVAQMLRDGAFDVAVDLKGHTEGARPGILAHRPCPVQINYLGYPGTIGAPWLDYIIGDAVVLPFSDQPFYSERIVHLPHCYQANDTKRRITEETPSRAACGLPESGVVFCCFNAAWKITPGLFDIWMRLLTAVPGSVLWLLEDNAAVPDHLRAAANARGVDTGRLIFAPRVPPADHLARHRLADIFLDTLPYNAHTTASDALWAGLPLVTCTGQQFDGRVAASLLLAMGLPELVTRTPGDYEALALALARDPERVAALRAVLAAARVSSPLYDIDRFRRHIETAYIRMVDAARSGAAAESFSVPG